MPAIPSSNRGARRLRSARTYAQSLTLLLVFLGASLTLCVARALHVPASLWALAVSGRDAGLDLALVAIAGFGLLIVGLVLYVSRELASARKEARAFAAYRS